MKSIVRELSEAAAPARSIGVPAVMQDRGGAVAHGGSLHLSYLSFRISVPLGSDSMLLRGEALRPPQDHGFNLECWCQV